VRLELFAGQPVVTSGFLQDLVPALAALLEDGPDPVLLFGSEEQKKKYLPDIASGKALAAFGLTEANAGSDALGMKTTARKDGDHYVLNGTKQWITNGENAAVYSVLAKTRPEKGARGISAFILEKGMDGFTFGKQEVFMGLHGMPYC